MWMAGAFNTKTNTPMSLQDDYKSSGDSIPGTPNPDLVMQIYQARQSRREALGNKILAAQKEADTAILSNRNSTVADLQQLENENKADDDQLLSTIAMPPLLTGSPSSSVPSAVTPKKLTFRTTGKRKLPPIPSAKAKKQGTLSFIKPVFAFRVPGLYMKQDSLTGTVGTAKAVTWNFDLRKSYKTLIRKRTTKSVSLVIAIKNTYYRNSLDCSVPTMITRR
jgi:hypothetical protein